MRKKTKIVATLGPASDSAESIAKLIHAGADVFRLNFSHGSVAEHSGRITRIRAVSKKVGRPVAILADLCGPKIRTGDFATTTVTLVPGSTFTLTTDTVVGDATRASVSYKKLPQEVRAGTRILLDDGKRVLLVKRVSGNDIICEVEVGGEIRGRRGVNVPNADLSIDCLTTKDRADALIAVKYPVDFFALSFVRSPDDIRELRAYLKKHRIEAGIIAKIETPQAVEHLPAIIEAADGLMVARGDLAVEMPAEQVPLIQKRMISMCNAAGKPVITATQMLDSMTTAPSPTRAEVSDIANAILDGTDAVMLSNETAVGAHPLEAVSVMSRVAGQVENDYLHRTIHASRRGHTGVEITDATTASAVLTAETIKAKAIVALTMSGRSARMLARHKPEQSIVALTPDETAYRRLALSFGVTPVRIKPPSRFVKVLPLVRSIFLKQGWAAKGDTVVVVCGLPFGEAVDTNLSLIERI